MSIPLTFEERFALGRQQRKHMRRPDHAAFTPNHRTESPIKILQAAYRGRLPALQPIKNQRMAVSPFSYFRGSLPVMAYDLSLSPNTNVFTQLCGDAHASNLGAFEGPGGELLFDINDFDETIAGPFEWDVKRMATSLILAGMEAGISDSLSHDAAIAFLESYRRAIFRFARMPVLKLARYQVHRINEIAPVSQLLATAQRSTPMHNLEALTELRPSSLASRKKSSARSKQPKDQNADLQPNEEITSESLRIFKSVPPILTRLTGVAAQRILDSLTPYAESLQVERRRFLARYQPLDVAFKVVGTGSVGLRVYCIYMEGNGPDDPLFLQIKEERPSAYIPYLGNNLLTAPFHQGRRVVEGERSMQLQSDPFLGWTTIEGRDYLVRQLNDHKASINIAGLKASALLEYAAVCGEILARGHSRAGDPVLLAGYIGSSDRFTKAIARFATSYARQTETDWKHFVKATGTTSTKTTQKENKKAVVPSKPVTKKTTRSK
ncbi:DUF2252 domain-containing protein [soil metagenome]